MASSAAAAKHIYLSTSRFRDLVAGGVITQQRSGNYNLDQVRREYILNLQKVSAGRGADGGAALSAQRARLATAQAVAAEKKNLISDGEYVRVAFMKDSLIELFSIMRERTLSLPGKVADALTPFSPKDRSEIDRILRGEVYELLEDLSSGKGLPTGRV